MTVDKSTFTTRKSKSSLSRKSMPTPIMRNDETKRLLGTSKRQTTDALDVRFDYEPMRYIKSPDDEVDDLSAELDTGSSDDLQRLLNAIHKRYKINSERQEREFKENLKQTVKNTVVEFQCHMDKFSATMDERLNKLRQELNTIYLERQRQLDKIYEEYEEFKFLSNAPASLHNHPFLEVAPPTTHSNCMTGMQVMNQPNLRVTIVKAEGLCKRSFFKYPDPFAVITINGEQTHNTHACISTLSPFWNSSFEFMVNERSTFNVQIFDQRKYMKNHQGFLGLVAIRVASVIDIRRKMTRSITAPLCSNDSDDSIRGTVTVVLTTDFVPSRPMSTSPACHPQSTLHTSSSAPAISVSSQKGQPALSNSLADEQGVLPPGWERRVDQFGRTYYVDHNTRTTSWTRPPVHMAPSDVERQQLQILNEQRQQLERRTLPTSLPLPSSIAASLPTVVDSGINSGPNIVKIKPEDFESYSRDLAKRLGDLPDGFEIRLDDHGRVYYADHIHQTTSWDDPRLPSSADASAPKYQRDFQRKLTYFRSQPEMRLRKGKVNIDIRRNSVFEDSYDRIMKLSAEELKQRINIRFDGEEGLDYGGVAREFFFLLSHEIFSPAYCLFEYSSHANYTLQISPRSHINPEHLEYFRFIGRVIGLAIFHQKFVDAFFVSSFYKQILGMEITLEDMESVDADVYKNLQWMLDNNVDDLGTVFAVDDDQFGVIVEEDLIPNGRNISVTNENKTDYVDLLVKWRVVSRVQEQMQAFLSGLFEIIPRSLLSIFDDREIELLIGGIAEINVEDWISNTVYRDCKADDQAVQWFWKCIKDEFDDEKRARLLQFTTGTSRVPVNGFKDLQGSDGPRKFCIQKMVDWSHKSLPKSHTCFNRIDLPPYRTYEDLVEKLTMAIEETIGFAQE